MRGEIQFDENLLFDRVAQLGEDLGEVVVERADAQCRILLREPIVQCRVQFARAGLDHQQVLGPMPVVASRVIVHPDDIPLLRDAGLTVDIAGDPALIRGTVILETGHGWVEDGPAVRLERFRAELDKLAARR